MHYYSGEKTIRVGVKLALVNFIQLEENSHFFYFSIFKRKVRHLLLLTFVIGKYLSQFQFWYKSKWTFNQPFSCQLIELPSLFTLSSSFFCIFLCWLEIFKPFTLILAEKRRTTRTTTVEIVYKTVKKNLFIFFLL